MVGNLATDVRCRPPYASRLLHVIILCAMPNQTFSTSGHISSHPQEGKKIEQRGCSSYR